MCTVWDWKVFCQRHNCLHVMSSEQYDCVAECYLGVRVRVRGRLLSAEGDGSFKLHLVPSEHVIAGR